MKPDHGAALGADEIGHRDPDGPAELPRLGDDLIGRVLARFGRRIFGIASIASTVSKSFIPIGIERSRRYRLRPSTIAFQSYRSMTRSVLRDDQLWLALVSPQPVDFAALALGRTAGAGLSGTAAAPARDRGGSGGVRSSKSARAASADPRRSPTPTTLRMRRRPRGRLTSMRSPARTRLRRLRRLRVDVHLAAVARGRGQASRLEHARGPEPLVHADRIRGGLHRETVS